MRIWTYQDPDYTTKIQSLNRRALPQVSIQHTVTAIIDAVRQGGNRALFAYAKQFDGVDLDAGNLQVSQEEIAEASASVDTPTREAIAASLRNIHFFAQKSLKKDWSAFNEQGCLVGERFTPFDRVGVYVPGGKAPLVSSALMGAGFAQAAGVGNIVAITPVDNSGKINPALLYALVESGATEIYKVGGAHGIAALALGTESIAPVEKIVGPGNVYVVEAKRQLVGSISIDLLPGPSEVLVLADHSAHPDFIAADMLAQAEHAGDSAVVFLTPSASLLNAVIQAIEIQIQRLSRAHYIKEVLEKNTICVQTQDMEQAVKLCNAFAPEHLSLVVEEEGKYLSKITTSGAIYQGAFSAVAVGDFLAGPSHTLPTGGSAKSFAGLCADTFQRRCSIVKINREALESSASAVETFARLEGLDAHGASVSLRLSHTHEPEKTTR